MKILGYSERGAMNALFYGIALKEDKDALVRFLSLAGINETYDDFDLYMEFSLSEYGDPDLLIIGTKSDGTKTVFFVEAKASNRGFYNVDKQKDWHNDYIKGGGHADGHSSNLFFQLRLKKYLKDDVILGSDPLNNLANTGGRARKIGENPIVLKMVDEIKKCGNAEYIAVIPKQKTRVKTNDDYGFTIHFVEWEDIQGDNVLNTYLNETVAFNGGVDKKGKSVNQILNI